MDVRSCLRGLGFSLFVPGIAAHCDNLTIAHYKSFAGLPRYLKHSAPAIVTITDSYDVYIIRIVNLKV